MHFKLSSFLAVAAATCSLATWGSFEEWKKSGNSRSSKHISTRPTNKFWPKTPRIYPTAGKRTKTCFVKANGNGTDDSANILSAIHKCNNGGHVVLNQAYTIGTALDLTFLKHIDIDISGYIQFTNDTDYWQANSFKLVFQNATTFWNFGGEDVSIYGGGTIDGNGQVWYDLYAKDIYILRPIILGAVGLHNSTIRDLNLRYSPEYYNFVANSSNVVYDNITIAGGSSSINVAKNTDGWDTYRSRDLVIQNSHVVNGDDCVSFKPNSTSIVVQNNICVGSHGISVGSLGQYVGEFDIVEDIYVYNTSMYNATDGARIKVWPNAPSALSGDLQGGGGSGRVNNITYDTFYSSAVDYAIEITQCYGQKNLTICQQYPSPITITNVLFKNFFGTTSSKYSPQTSVFACSSDSVCSNITAADLDVYSPTGTNQAFCLNVDQSTLDVNCTSTSLGFN